MRDLYLATACLLAGIGIGIGIMHPKPAVQITRPDAPSSGNPYDVLPDGSVRDSRTGKLIPMTTTPDVPRLAPAPDVPNLLAPAPDEPRKYPPGVVPPPPRLARPAPPLPTVLPPGN